MKYRLNIFSSTSRLYAATILSTLVVALPFAQASDRESLANELIEKLDQHSDGRGASAFRLPDKNDLASIPQDPENPITRDKINLGRFLYHDTATGTEATDPERTGTWSCASCHHVAAGFKAGIPQGIGDGGIGFGSDGGGRRLRDGLDALAPAGDSRLPDLQPLTSPTTLNTAYQDVMLWNGSFGNSPGSINSDADNLATAGPAGVFANSFGLSGLETQVIAGTRVHRLRFDNDSILQTNSEYRYLYDRAFPDGDTGFLPDNDTVVSAADLGAAKAIAAYERIILSNLAPFQRWLAGDGGAMSVQQLRGANLFFGKADCVSCHTGPALSSNVNAPAEEVFFAVGFNDFDTSDPLIHGAVDDASRLGRGGFTGNPVDNYKFKVPQLYNLTDTNVFGHGASFDSVRDVVAYKNAARAQNPASVNNLSDKFTPLGLTDAEVDDLVVFLEEALYDSWLERYVPGNVPSDQCFPVADVQSAIDLDCVTTTPQILSHPVCEYSISDPDNDGWGWENNRSCIVVSTTSAAPVDSGEGHPECRSALSDPDNDGWGWENQRSCRVVN